MTNAVKGFIPVHQDDNNGNLVYVNYKRICDILPTKTGSSISYGLNDFLKVTESVDHIIKLIEDNQIY